MYIHCDETHCVYNDNQRCELGNSEYTELLIESRTCRSFEEDPESWAAGIGQTFSPD